MKLQAGVYVNEGSTFNPLADNVIDDRDAGSDGLIGVNPFDIAETLLRGIEHVLSEVRAPIDQNGNAVTLGADWIEARFLNAAVSIQESMIGGAGNEQA